MLLPVCLITANSCLKAETQQKVEIDKTLYKLIFLQYY